MACLRCHQILAVLNISSSLFVFVELLVNLIIKLTKQNYTDWIAYGSTSLATISLVLTSISVYYMICRRKNKILFLPNLAMLFIILVFDFISVIYIFLNGDFDIKKERIHVIYNILLTFHSNFLPCVISASMTVLSFIIILSISCCLVEKKKSHSKSTCCLQTEGFATFFVSNSCLWRWMFF